MKHGRKIALIGLGYVGLPVAVAFWRSGVPLFDINERRIAELKGGHDWSREVEVDLRQTSLMLTSDSRELQNCDFYIVTVPTPVEVRRPDLSAALEALRTVGGALKTGDLALYESIVYLGTVEEHCLSILAGPFAVEVGMGFLLRQRVQNGIVTILGLTFKEDVPHMRNSQVIDIIRELEPFGLGVQVHDPLASAADAELEYGGALKSFDGLRPADAVILALAHDHYVAAGWPLIQRLLVEGKGLVFDVKMRLDRCFRPAGIELWRL